jgi:UDP-N-acetylmuramate--alanine ligase
MKHIHFIGIAGTGLSAIARVLIQTGYPVSGSDQAPSPFSEQLEKDGARIFIGHHAANIEGADLIVRSSAIPESNVEVQAAKQAGIPVLKRSEFLGQLMADQTGIAVAGTHGKTTTTAMIATMLSGMKLDPSFIIGGIAKNLGCNAQAGKGPYFVIEADEYDRMFHGLQPAVSIITSMEHDHPDCYPTPESYREAFVKFAERLKPNGVLLAETSNPDLQILRNACPSNCRFYSYGLANEATYKIDNIQTGHFGMRFDIIDQTDSETSKKLVSVDLQVPGVHNVLNATAALAAAHQLGLSINEAAEALNAFTGTGRRFDIQGEVDGVIIVDDYAHHPTEIRATLAAARGRYPGKRIWAVWQPHTYTRTQTLLDEFASSFKDADHVIVTKVYAARETNNSFSANEVVEKMPNQNALYIPELMDVSKHLIENLKTNDVLLVLSAGDAIEISQTVLRTLENSVK